MRYSSTATLMCALLTLACGGHSPAGPSAEPVAFTSTTSFGFCLPTSYCSSRLDVSIQDAVFTRESREHPALVQRRGLEPSEWARLVAAADAARLRALPEVIGCPDCADGGAESVSVSFAGAPAVKVTFEYGHDVPEIQRLLDELRAIRATFARPELP